MAGIRITDLPSVDDIRSTDQLIIARGETTRKAYGTALVTKQDVVDLTTFVSRISAGTLNTRKSQFISLYYDNQTKTLSAEIASYVWRNWLRFIYRKSAFNFGRIRKASKNHTHSRKRNSSKC
jgi:hypothetical protein